MPHHMEEASLVGTISAIILSLLLLRGLVVRITALFARKEAATCCGSAASNASGATCCSAKTKPVEDECTCGHKKNGKGESGCCGH